MMAASAGVVLPPKLKSALPPVTACSVGAWFGNGPSHSTLIPSLARSFSNSPRSLAIRLRPLRPQVRRTVSVTRPVAACRLSEMLNPARAPMPAAAPPRKCRRVGFVNEKSDMKRSFQGNSRRGGIRGDDAELGQQFGARDCRGSLAPRLVFKGDLAIPHNQDAVGERDRLVDVVADQENAGL